MAPGGPYSLRYLLPISKIPQIDFSRTSIDLQIKLDIVPDKGWQSEDMFVPPGYHLDSTITEGESSPKEAEMTPYAYPAGLGTVLMNGCYGTGYQEGDPCYVATWTLDACLVKKK